jgi:hypothetical protein
MKLRCTLVERYLAAEPCIRGSEPIDSLKLDKLVREKLDPPFQHFLLAHPAEPAERFVFDFDPAIAMYDLLDRKAVTAEQIKLMVRLPSPVMWIESMYEDISYGMLVDSTELFTHMVVICETSKFPPRLMVEASLREFKIHVTDQQEMRYRINWAHKPGADPLIKSLALPFLVGALFHLNIPKMIEVRKSQGKPHHRAASPGRINPGVIEFKQVFLKPGLKNIRYESQRQKGETEIQYRKRLHHVVGHCRTMTHYRDKQFAKPIVAWIEPHWRGDANLGVVLHETHIVEPTGD